MKSVGRSQHIQDCQPPAHMCFRIYWMFFTPDFDKSAPGPTRLGLPHKKVAPVARLAFQLAGARDQSAGAGVADACGASPKARGEGPSPQLAKTLSQGAMDANQGAFGGTLWLVKAQKDGEEVAQGGRCCSRRGPDGPWTMESTAQAILLVMRGFRAPVGAADKQT